MPMVFDETYFTDGTRGYKNYQNYPHFAQRALWIKNNLSGSILEVGCAYGYLMAELKALGITIEGVDKSKYIKFHLLTNIAGHVTIADISDVVLIEGQYDWITSWNTLDCLDNEDHAIAVAEVLNTAKNQLHILSMGEKRSKYTDMGYFIRDILFWRKLLPNAVLVCSECKAVYNPITFKFSHIPLHTGKGVSD